MKANRLVVSALVGLRLLATACGPQATPVAVPLPTQRPATTAPNVAVPVTGAASIDLSKDDKLVRSWSMTRG